MSNSALFALREHLKNNDKFTLLDKNNDTIEDINLADKVSFEKEGGNDKYILSLDEETEFSIEGKPVVLKVILHCWIHKDSNAADYLADCQKLHLTNISFLQRNDLMNWLTGQSETSQYIVTSRDQGIKAVDENNNTVASNNATNTVTTSTIIGSTTQTTYSNDRNSGLSELEVIQNEDPVLFKTIQHERVLVDHNSSLRGSKPVDFSYLIKDVELKLVQSLKGSSSSKTGKNKGHVSKNNGPSKSVLRKDPIILIPSATSSILTLSNIKEFLEHSKYINPRDITITTDNDLVTVEKKFEKISRPIRFLIVNNTRMFTKPEYWDRVVAVFTTGHTWQFSNYQWNTAQDLFQHCNGYYFHFNGDEVPQHVQQWNVQRIALDKHQRFKDVEVVRFFWSNLEKSLIAKGYH
ncbi:similar to Saccharomyces cerevisiae YLR418C CDC73 Component of the Paf1p complex [Maudiozyma barnettii]|uniref:Similar to Saccharomyces cerevisiae YLR418C CDC73 Component of the Paf1p complex n=1 Tax=Maudiozyma barnettii TaxID=61262 RepID=A0A8H2VIS5_9SACH|nr:Cdc73p [Kazachstania barnettii]CAB4256186.1 similar to Saccharomyces cerevisiae YLR418C CDC73 Component of the Paf1p complex [Kazachstania barnettii]CAD1784794.1 similar to Saccharomyces cerevisiae YLR418C CDC73 Component of the Paf1p complex [Kazachstania barnettii]